MSEHSERKPFARTRRHGPVGRANAKPTPPRPRRQTTTGSATGAIARPRRATPPDRPGRAAPPQPPRRARRRPGVSEHVASLGEARAHRRLRLERERDTARRGGGRDHRQRARRVITTTKPLISSRLGAGQPRRRLILTLVGLVLVLGFVLGKVALMQGGGTAEALRNAGAAQWTRDRELPAQRGAIFDRNGTDLALSVPAATVVVNPTQIDDPAGTARVLGSVLGFGPEREAELAAAIAADADKNIGFRYVARQVDASLGDRIAELRLTGVQIVDEDKRIMPTGRTGQSVIGRTDIDGVGISGLELQFEDILQGQPGEMTVDVAPGGRTVAGSEQIVRPPVEGLDLVTTLDRSVQHFVEDALVDRVNATRAKGGQVIVMLTSGDIVAMASVERDDRGVAVVSPGNWAAVGAYEPGSVGKVITVAGALQDGVVDPDTHFNVPWRYDCTLNVNDGWLHDSHEHADQWLSVGGVLSESSNVGTILVSRQLGYERQYHYLTAFGIGQRTGLGFPGESDGILKPWQEWEGTERCTMAYGQGLASTPVQLAAAVNTIANNGVYVSPRLVTGTVGEDGAVTPSAAPTSREVLSPGVAATVQQMMKAVVCDGTADAAQVDGLSVAGKTGTAYKAQEDGTYFLEDGIHHAYYSSFVGFFPAEAPEVTILVSIDEPAQGYNSGSQSAAPLFQELVPTIRHELGIVPPPGSTDCAGR